MACSVQFKFSPFNPCDMFDTVKKSVLTEKRRVSSYSRVKTHRRFTVQTYRLQTYDYKMLYHFTKKRAFTDRWIAWLTFDE